MGNREQKTTPENTLNTSLKQLRDALQGANNLIPCFVQTCILLAGFTIYISLQFTGLITAIAFIIILFTSILIFHKSGNYGEAALSLAAGLFSVFSTDWTTRNAIVFFVMWIAFSLFALMVSSIKLASTECVKQLRQLSTKNY